MYMTYELTPQQIGNRIATAILGRGPSGFSGTWDLGVGARPSVTWGWQRRLLGPLRSTTDAQT
jgi:hypothetical protein